MPGKKKKSTEKPPTFKTCNLFSALEVAGLVYTLNTWEKQMVVSQKTILEQKLL